jgi:hypothetical protein
MTKIVAGNGKAGCVFSELALAGAAVNNGGPLVHVARKQK